MLARVLRQTGGGTVARNTTPITAGATTRNMSSGYGDPEQTGYSASQSRQSASSIEREHPGPQPVDEGKGSGQQSSTAGAGGSGGGSGGSGGSSGGAAKGKPQPKIHPNRTPGGQGDKDVERHNQEMAERYDKRMAAGGSSSGGSGGGKGGDDNVGKGYWKGLGGRDRDS